MPFYSGLVRLMDLIPSMLKNTQRPRTKIVQVVEP